MSSQDNIYIEHFNQGYENEDNLYFLTEKSDNNTEFSDNIYAEHFAETTVPAPSVAPIKKQKSYRWLTIFIIFIIMALIYYYFIDNNIEMYNLMSSSSSINSNVASVARPVLTNQFISLN